MDKKINFTSKELLNKRFSNTPRGYDPLEVDKVLDKIIEDYETYENIPSGIDTEKVAKELEELRKANNLIRKTIIF